MYSYSELYTLYVCDRVLLHDGFCERACSWGRATVCSVIPGYYDFGILAHRGREFLYIWTETEERLTGV